MVMENKNITINNLLINPNELIKKIENIESEKRAKQRLDEVKHLNFIKNGK